jgi:hypothetical protein
MNSEYKMFSHVRHCEYGVPVYNFLTIQDINVSKVAMFVCNCTINQIGPKMCPTLPSPPLSQKLTVLSILRLGKGPQIIWEALKQSCGCSLGINIVRGCFVYANTLQLHRCDF